MRRAAVLLVLLVVVAGVPAPPAARSHASAAAQDQPTATPTPTATATPTPTQLPTLTPVPTATQGLTFPLDPSTVPAPSEPGLPEPAPPSPAVPPQPTAASTPSPQPEGTRPPLAPTEAAPPDPTVPTPPASTKEGTTERPAEEERTIPEPTLTPEPPAPPALLEPTVIAIQAPAAADESPLTLTVRAGAVDFGRVSADGTLDPAVPTLSSTTDSRGAYYVLAGAIQVNVTSDVPWTGSCRVAENAGSAATIPIAAGRLEWRLAGTEGWTPFAPNLPDPACFPAPEVGSQMFVYDLRLRVEAGDPPGAVAAVLAFEATP